MEKAVISRTTSKTPLTAQFIALCGMNCGLCAAYLREKKKYPGCNGGNVNKSPVCVQCRIKNCVRIAENKSKFCFDCEDYPCNRLTHLDTRYRTKYHMSMIENLESIKKPWNGEVFERTEEKMEMSHLR